MKSNTITNNINIKDQRRNQSNIQKHYQKKNEKKEHKREKYDYEKDIHRITQRMAQLDIGRNTKGYRNYIKCIPKNMREYGNQMHPHTPNPRFKISNRRWKGVLLGWRIALHRWDIQSSVKKVKKDSKVKSDLNVNPIIDEYALLTTYTSTFTDKINDCLEIQGGIESESEVKSDSICDKLQCEKCFVIYEDLEKWHLHRMKCNGKKNDCKIELDIVNKGCEDIPQEMGFSFMNTDEINENCMLSSLDIMSKEIKEEESQSADNNGLMGILNDILDDC